jgi:hypothetical protein
MALDKSVTYAQCQIYTTADGATCPLCDKPLEPGMGHYCEVRALPEAKEEPNVDR